MPNFHKSRLPGKGVQAKLLNTEDDDVRLAKVDPVSEVIVMDTRIPEFSVGYRGFVIEQVLIDGGAGVNIVTRATCKKMGWMDWLPTPFLAQMADQRRVHPLGILKGIVLDIGGISFAMSFVVMGMEEANEEYNLLLGRPWLRQAKVRHNWELNQLTIRCGHRKVKVSLQEHRQLKSAVWSVIAETINMVEGLEEDEEEKFL